MTPPRFTQPEVVDVDIRTQLEAMLDDYRDSLECCLDGLTEVEARQRLVPSLTTLLGLVAHATFFEAVWFDEAVTSRPREELGIPATVDESFALSDRDTIETVLTDFRTRCARSRATVASIGFDDHLTGNKRGPLPLRWVYLHVLREYVQHTGHAEILREQILAARETE